MDTLNWLSQLLAIDSPSGFTERASVFLVDSLRELGLDPKRTGKGAVTCSLGAEPRLTLAAHTDTLGAVVSSIQGDGTLRFSLIGGPLLPTFESAYVRVHTRGGSVVQGTVLLDNPSAHANNKAATKERTTDTMHVRLDEKVSNADDVRALNISVGDIVAFDTRCTVLPNGYIKSHFLDNKAGCAVLFDVAKSLKNNGLTVPVELYFSVYEEVGHGGAGGYAPTMEELLVIDMGVVGDSLQGNETLCSICAKDSGGPYDYGFRTKLTEIAEQNRIPHAVDVYPFYSSDGTAAWRAGVDARVALIGPGVHASHGMERTHIDGINATTELCLAYIKHRFATS
ncbi:MAG: M42 family metallopeptidase [bacterium]|nr:M42 family metallopeptidase [bacterium]